jgi:hypothetical protein
MDSDGGVSGREKLKTEADILMVHTAFKLPVYIQG